MSHQPSQIQGDRSLVPWQEKSNFDGDTKSSHPKVKLVEGKAPAGGNRKAKSATLRPEISKPQKATNGKVSVMNISNGNQKIYSSLSAF